MFKYFFGSILATFRSEWTFLRDNSSPSTILLTPFYSMCLKALTNLREILSLKDWADLQFSAKKCYRALLKKRSSLPVLPRPWVSLLRPGFLFERHMSLVHDGFSENYIDDLSWLITLRAVKVRDSLHSWGYIASDRCAKCNLKETIDHCFLNCVRVKRVWHRFSTTLSALLSSRFVHNCVSVSFSTGKLSIKRMLALPVILSNLFILYDIWKFRNKCTFYYGAERFDAIIRYIIQDVKTQINIDFFLFPLTPLRTPGNPLCAQLFLTC